MPVIHYSEIVLALAFTLLALVAILAQPPLAQQGASARLRQPIFVVIITGKRMSAEEKRLSLAE